MIGQEFRSAESAERNRCRCFGSPLPFSSSPRSRPLPFHATDWVALGDAGRSLGEPDGRLVAEHGGHWPHRPESGYQIG
ncbi:MAG: hypothetical protein EA381_14445 [Planctomycetaceae bacterium]|nr:MAG: hypothetical protein EA381_14445 [Planctomycetaceae bacterium]